MQQLYRKPSMHGATNRSIVQISHYHSLHASQSNLADNCLRVIVIEPNRLTIGRRRLDAYFWTPLDANTVLSELRMKPAAAHSESARSMKSEPLDLNRCFVFPDTDWFFCILRFSRLLEHIRLCCSGPNKLR